MKEKVKQALKKLNCDRQDFSFCQWVKQVKPAASVLIHSNEGYGQRWLVNRLAYRIPQYSPDAYKLPLRLKAHRKDIKILWAELGKELNRPASPQAIAEALYQRWQTQTVILALYDIDRIAGESLRQFMLEFWQPLMRFAALTPMLTLVDDLI